MKIQLIKKIQDQEEADANKKQKIKKKGEMLEYLSSIVKKYGKIITNRNSSFAKRK